MRNRQTFRRNWWLLALLFGDACGKEDDVDDELGSEGTSGEGLDC